MSARLARAFGPASCSYLMVVAGFEPLPQAARDAADRFDVPDRKALRETVDPWCLQAHRAVVGLLALVGQDDQLRATVMRIGPEGHELVLFQVVDDALHVLSVGAEVARQPCDRLRV